MVFQIPTAFITTGSLLGGEWKVPPSFFREDSVFCRAPQDRMTIFVARVYGIPSLDTSRKKAIAIFFCPPLVLFLGLASRLLSHRNCHRFSPSHCFLFFPPILHGFFPTLRGTSRCQAVGAILPEIDFSGRFQILFFPPFELTNLPNFSQSVCPLMLGPIARKGSPFFSLVLAMGLRVNRKVPGFLRKIP